MFALPLLTLSALACSSSPSASRAVHPRLTSSGTRAHGRPSSKVYLLPKKVRSSPLDSSPSSYSLLEVVHGSILALGELLRSSLPFMSDKYTDAAGFLLSRLNSSSKVFPPHRPSHCFFSSPLACQARGDLPHPRPRCPLPQGVRSPPPRRDCQEPLRCDEGR